MMEEASGKKVLITGGVRSGKSRFAINSALSYPTPRVFLATAEPLDQEMHERILRHRAERKDQFLTIEEPLDLAEKILQMDFNPSVVIIDCITTWLGNLYHHLVENEPAIRNRMNRLTEVVGNNKRTMILVTNEVGLGVISNHALGRRFVDALGTLNQELARICHEVVFMNCGIPQMIKGTLQDAKVDCSIKAC